MCKSTLFTKSLYLVNFLDLIVDNGYSLSIYFKYIFLNVEKRQNRVLYAVVQMHSGLGNDTTISQQIFPILGNTISTYIFVLRKVVIRFF